jgi:hypothetical protein
MLMERTTDVAQARGLWGVLRPLGLTVFSKQGAAAAASGVGMRVIAALFGPGTPQALPSPGSVCSWTARGANDGQNAP